VGDPARIYGNLGDVIPVGFANDGSYFYEVYSRWVNNYVAEIDPKTSKPLGVITEPLVGYNRSLDWSSDGRHLVYVSVESTPEGPGAFLGLLRIRGLETGVDRMVPCDLLGVVDVRWSPDGKALLVSGFKKREVIDFRMKTGLYLVNPETAATQCLADEPDQRIIIGEWTPDGKGIYFVRGDSLFSYDLHSGREKEIFSQAQLTGLLALCPDGRGLVLGAKNPREGSEALLLVDLSNGSSRQLVSYPEANVVRGLFDWSPDGKFLCYLKREERGTSLCRIDLQTETPEKIWETEKRVQDLRFHPNGREIVFAETHHETMIWVMENLLPENSESG
jgi:Tol biopolymer transport system component